MKNEVIRVYIINVIQELEGYGSKGAVPLSERYFVQGMKQWHDTF
jgi:hypothetical protein